MEIKSTPKIFQIVFLVIITALPLFFISACQKTSTTVLTPENYNNYLEVTAGEGGGAGAFNFWMPNCYVRIKKISDSSSFQNVTISYKFKLYDAGHTINLEQEFTESLGDLKTDYYNPFQLRFDHTNGRWPPELYTTIEVLEISGTNILISGKSDNEILSYIGLIFIIIFTVGLLIFFPARARVFSNKFNTITNGMTYQEVINILGEPSESNSAKDIKTCIWKRAILRGWTKTYVLTFKDGKVVLDITHSGW